MPVLISAPPFSEIETVTEILHGMPISDPYRWLEDQDSPRTREWILVQTQYARSYLDSIPEREQIRKRVRQFLDVEMYDSVQRAGNRYFFRKRVAGQEQPCICVRDGADGADEVLIDPAQRATGTYTAVKPLQISPDGNLLLYEIKQGGERTGTFELFDIRSREILPDTLGHGYLRGFAFSPASESFYYVHEALEPKRPRHHAVYKHVLGTDLAEDVEVFFAGEGEAIRLNVVPGVQHLGFLVATFQEEQTTDFYLWSFEREAEPIPLIRNAKYMLGPLLLNDGRILALTDCSAPNFRIVELLRNDFSSSEFKEVVPEIDSPIQNWCVIGDRLAVSYFRNLKSEIRIFSLSGEALGTVPVDECATVRLLDGCQSADELLLEQESFTTPIHHRNYSVSKRQFLTWAQRKTPFDAARFCQVQTWFGSTDGTHIPIFLVGSRDALEGAPRPTIMTAYGGYGVSMTPQFSVFVAFLLERGCVFALPNIRGGSEFGAEWHKAAQRRNRQTAFDDFLCAAEWLIQTRRTEPRRLAIFGGSNSGLLVGAAISQRPELFRAALCIAPLMDMLRYHLFDDAQLWSDEFGTSADADDFSALLQYSPYQNVKEKTAYPATMIVSGDRDQKCNPFHARKMTARLQASNLSENVILLDYRPERGHSPVMPLSERIEALTDRLAFMCDQLQLAV